MSNFSDLYLVRVEVPCVSADAFEAIDLLRENLSLLEPDFISLEAEELTVFGWASTEAESLDETKKSIEVALKGAGFDLPAIAFVELATFRRPKLGED